MRQHGSRPIWASRAFAAGARLGRIALVWSSTALLDGYRARSDASPAVAAGLAELHAMIRQRAPAEQVWAASRRLLPELAGSLAVGIRPQRSPDLANGRRLWASDCVPCHGPTGAGDGPVAMDLEPPPTALVGQTRDRLSPRQAFNALTFGIDGTAMPSFAPAYTEQDRWDVAFFLMTLGEAFTPRRPRHGQTVSLDALATHPNVELLSTLRQRWPDTSPDEVDWLRTNYISTGAPTPAAQLAAPSGDGLAAALQLQDAELDLLRDGKPRQVVVPIEVRPDSASMR